MCMYTYIYIYIERERERYTHTYIYIYICRGTNENKPPSRVRLGVRPRSPSFNVENEICEGVFWFDITFTLALAFSKLQL